MKGFQQHTRDRNGSNRQNYCSKDVHCGCTQPITTDTVIDFSAVILKLMIISTDTRNTYVHIKRQHTYDCIILIDKRVSCHIEYQWLLSQSDITWYFPITIQWEAIILSINIIQPCVCCLIIIDVDILCINRCHHWFENNGTEVDMALKSMTIDRNRWNAVSIYDAIGHKI